MSGADSTAATSTPLPQTTARQYGQADDKEVDSLLQSALSGDIRAVERLIAEIRPIVVSYCRGRLGRNAGRYDIADDAAQETCLAVVSALPRFRHMGRPFLAFVYGIAAHKVADARRREGTTPSPVEALPDRADDSPGPEEHAVRLHRAREARDLLDQLPEQQRDVLLLRVVSGMSAGETGKALGLTAGNIRVQQHRALTRLRATLSTAGETL